MAIIDEEATNLSRPDQMDRAVTDRVSRMVESALRYCEGKSACQGREAVLIALRTENPQLHDYFRHSLACQAAEYLAGLDDEVVGIYTHSFGDSEEEGEDRGCSVTASINLIIHVHRKTAAVGSVVAALDQALAEWYRTTIAIHNPRMASLLDVQVVDDRSVEEGTGFGAVLRPTYLKPVRVWPRQ